jgi:hypothetical protein
MRALARSLLLHLHPTGATAALVLALVLAGCSAGTSTAPPTTAAAATTETSTTETSTTAAEAPCSPADFLPVVKQQLDRDTDKLRIVRADVVRCRNDYARVSAVPDMSVCPPNCYDTAEVYLRWTGGRWRILDVGTGISCEDTTSLPPLPAQIRRACRALGYPQPAILVTPTFQMPSRTSAVHLRAGSSAATSSAG